MPLIWLFLGFLAGYWTSEWPRRAFPGEGRPLKASEMTDPEVRTAAGLFGLPVFALALLLTIAAFMAAQRFAPELSERYMSFWALFVILGAVGAAVGVFEIATGISPSSHYFDDNGKNQKFYVDRERAEKVGAWRLASCLLLNIMAFVVCQLLRSAP